MYVVCVNLCLLKWSFRSPPDLSSYYPFKKNQGFLATVVRNIPGNAAYFGTFQLLQQQYASHYGIEDPSQVPAVVHFWCGGLGGVMYWLAVYPIDVVKSTMMTDSLDASQRRFKGYGDIVSFLSRQNGIRSFFRGFGVCMLRAIPANGAIFFTVMGLKSRNIPW